MPKDNAKQMTQSELDCLERFGHEINPGTGKPYWDIDAGGWIHVDPENLERVGTREYKYKASRTLRLVAYENGKAVWTEWKPTMTLAQHSKQYAEDARAYHLLQEFQKQFGSEKFEQLLELKKEINAAGISVDKFHMFLKLVA